MVLPTNVTLRSLLLLPRRRGGGEGLVYEDRNHLKPVERRRCVWRQVSKNMSVNPNQRLTQPPILGREHFVSSLRCSQLRIALRETALIAALFGDTDPLFDFERVLFHHFFPAFRRLRFLGVAPCSV